MIISIQPSHLLFFTLVVLLNQITLCFSASPFSFRDVSISAGLRRPLGRRKKYGGAAVADLDGDGWPDLICGHHDDRTLQIYFNNRDGTFKLSRFTAWYDTHALTPFRVSPWDKSMHFILSRGGSSGKRLAAPLIFRVTEKRQIFEVTSQSPDFRLRKYRGRGRGAVALALRQNGRSYHKEYPDILITNAPDGTQRHQKGFDVRWDGTFRGKDITGSGNFPGIRASYVGVTDIDNDMKMEVLSWINLQIWRLDGYFTLNEITSSVLPKPSNQYYSIVSIVELDYNNDGFWDLFLTRSATGDISWVTERPVHDNLLKNNQGKFYTDVTTKAGVRTGWATRSRGATAADFDNDGYVDILVSNFDNQYGIYTMYRNVRGKSFERMSVTSFYRMKWSTGDAVTAVDYNRDGRVDVVISEGEWNNKQQAGYYRILKNNVENGNSWLLVRVKSAPGRKTTSLHAVVTVITNNGRQMRRVGSPGTTVSNSYIELCHFGLGRNSWVRRLSVRWTDGSVVWKENVKANQTLTFGI